MVWWLSGYEKQEYSQLKKLRWSLLTNGDKLSGSKTEHLQSILQDHHDLAVCYAMKEEICRLYTLKDYDEAVKSWTDWFVAAKESEIPALVKFAEQKEKRLPGLAAHAIYPISTGKLEGFNNKITPSYPQCCKYSYPHAQQPLICLNEE